MSDSKQYVKRFFGDRVAEWAAHYSDLEPRNLGLETSGPGVGLP
jgi:hypothetical protein